MSEELKAKNCPKCGKEADKIFYEFDQPRTGCSDDFCICHGGDSGYDLVVWNKRQPDTRIEEALEVIESGINNLDAMISPYPYPQGGRGGGKSHFVEKWTYARGSFLKIKSILEGE